MSEDSHLIAGAPVSSSTFTSLLKSSKLRILSFSLGTPSSRSSLRFFRHRLSLIASSFDKACEMKTFCCFSSFRLSTLLANTNLTSCDVASVTSRVRGLVLSLLTFPNRFISNTWGLAPRHFSTSFTFSFVGMRFSFRDFSGYSLIPCILKLLSVLCVFAMTLAFVSVPGGIAAFVAFLAAIVA